MGDADITRDQFNSSKRVMRKIAQRDYYIVDADFNEVGQILDYRLTEALNLIAQGIAVRFGSGWVISGGSNQIEVSAGKALINISSSQSYILTLTGNQAVTGFTTPSGGNRNDVVYLDISFPIFDVGDDATLVNPTVGKEACVDLRLAFSFVVLQGTIGGGVPSIPTAPAGHYYVSVAQIARTSGVATINAIDIRSQITMWEPLRENVVWTQAQQAAAGASNAEVADWDNAANVLSAPQEATATYYKKIRVPLWKTTGFNTVVIRFEVRMSPGSTGSPNLRFTVNGFPAVTWFESSTTWHRVEKEVRVDSAVTNADIFALLELQSAGANSTDTLQVRKAMLLTASKP